MSNGISKPASQRLIKLVSLLEQLEEEAKVSKKDDIPKTVTSSLIEHRTGWTRDTIRRDISLLGVQCGSSSGYNIQELKEAIKSKLFVSMIFSRSFSVGELRVLILLCNTLRASSLLIGLYLRLTHEVSQPIS